MYSKIEIEEQILRYFSGKSSCDELMAITDWLKSDEKNKTLYLEFSKYIYDYIKSEEATKEFFPNASSTSEKKEILYRKLKTSMRNFKNCEMQSLE